MSIALFRKMLKKLVLFKRIDDDSFMKEFNNLIYSDYMKSARDEHQSILNDKWLAWYGKEYPNK